MYLLYVGTGYLIFDLLLLSFQKKILLYERDMWTDYLGYKNLGELCPGGLGKLCNLEFQNDRKRSVHDFEDVAAVVIRVDLYHRNYNLELPDHVTRIFYFLDHPPSSKGTLSRPRDLLASYWTNSDIPIPYGKWVYYNPTVTSAKQSMVNHCMIYI